MVSVAAHQWCVHGACRVVVTQLADVLGRDERRRAGRLQWRRMAALVARSMDHQSTSADIR
jgi:hypothetical protein